MHLSNNFFLGKEYGQSHWGPYNFIYSSQDAQGAWGKRVGGTCGCGNFKTCQQYSYKSVTLVN